MGKITVKNNVRYHGKDADREDDIVPVKRNEPVADTDQWAKAEAEKARAALDAELAETRRKHDAELAQERADFESEIAARREALDAELEKAAAKTDEAPVKAARRTPKTEAAS